MPTEGTLALARALAATLNLILTVTLTPTLPLTQTLTLTHTLCGGCDAYAACDAVSISVHALHCAPTNGDVCIMTSRRRLGQQQTKAIITAFSSAVWH